MIDNINFDRLYTPKPPVVIEHINTKIDADRLLTPQKPNPASHMNKATLPRDTVEISEVSKQYDPEELPVTLTPATPIIPSSEILEEAKPEQENKPDDKLSGFSIKEL